MKANALYDSADLVEVIRTIRTPQRFFLSRFFRAAPYLSTKAEIVFDEVLEDLPAMAPFVAPIVAAKPQKRSGYQAKSFTPAYVKPKHFLKPGDFIRRTAGEALLGDLTPEARMNAARLDMLALQKRQIEERKEWLAAKAIVDGKVTISGEDYPSVQVDFGRDASNNITVSGAGNLWSNPDADIASMLEDWSDQILGKTGYAGTDVILSPEAWKLFRKNEQVLKEADLRRGVQNIPNLQAQVAVEGARLAGQWGEFTLWVYAGRFKEQNGTLSRAIEANHVVMTAAPSAEDGTGGVQGMQCFGAIQDVQANLQAVEIFPKEWMEEDPSGIQLMSQSAPLMVPGRPNAVIRAKVA